MPHAPRTARGAPRPMHRALGMHRPALGLGDQAQGLDVTPQGRTSLHEPTGAQEPWRKMVTACLRPLDDCTKAPPLVSTAGPARGPGAAASCIYSCSAPRHRCSAGRCQPRLSSGGSAPRGVPAVLPALVPGAAGSAVQDVSITIPVIPQWPPAVLSLIRPGGSESSRGHFWGGGSRPLCPRAP